MDRAGLHRGRRNRPSPAAARRPGMAGVVLVHRSCGRIARPRRCCGGRPPRRGTCRRSHRRATACGSGRYPSAVLSSMRRSTRPHPGRSARCTAARMAERLRVQRRAVALGSAAGVVAQGPAPSRARSGGTPTGRGASRLAGRGAARAGCPRRPVRTRTIRGCSDAIVSGIVQVFVDGMATWAAAPQLRLTAAAIDPAWLPTLIVQLSRLPFHAATQRTLADVLSLAEFRLAMLREFHPPTSEPLSIAPQVDHS